MIKNRDFDPVALNDFANSKLKANWSPGFFSHGSLWQFRIFLPRWVVRGSVEAEVCTAMDQDLLQTLFERDFGGYTASLSFLRGVGYRGSELETNLHAELIVLASRWRGTMRTSELFERNSRSAAVRSRSLFCAKSLLLFRTKALGFTQRFFLRKKDFVGTCA